MFLLIYLDSFCRQYQDYGQSGYSPNNTYHGYQTGQQVNNPIILMYTYALSAVTLILRFLLPIKYTLI